MAVAAAEVAVGLAIIVVDLPRPPPPLGRRSQPDALVARGRPVAQGATTRHGPDDDGARPQTAGVDAALAKRLLHDMMLIRRFEEKAAEGYALGKIGGFLHLYIGEEAVAVGATSMLRPDDYAISAYREHGHCLAKGSDPRAGHGRAVRPARRAQQGQGRLDAPVRQEHELPGRPRDRGPHLPLAAGVAFAIKYEERDQVIVCYFGDGAVPEGEFHEAMNLAALWKLPVIFICENNRYAMGTHWSARSPRPDLEVRRDLRHPGRAGGRHGRAGRARGASGRAVERARRDEGPSLMEARTYRFRGHSMRDPAGAVYRTRGGGRAREAPRPHRAVPRAGARRPGSSPRPTSRRSRRQVNDLMDEAVAFADASPEPPAEWLFTDIFKEPDGEGKA